MGESVPASVDSILSGFYRAYGVCPQADRVLPDGAGAVPRCYSWLMCRNIRVLANFAPPTTEEEMRAAALQYVRKVSGMTKPALANEEAFQAAVEEIAQATEKLLRELPARAPQRTREGEREKAKLRAVRRFG